MPTNRSWRGYSMLHLTQLNQAWSRCRLNHRENCLISRAKKGEQFSLWYNAASLLSACQNCQKAATEVQLEPEDYPSLLRSLIGQCEKAAYCISHNQKSTLKNASTFALEMIYGQCQDCSGPPPPSKRPT